MTALRSRPGSPEPAALTGDSPGRAVRAGPGRIGFPTPPQVQARRDFPLVASAAPVVGSVAMFVVTGSAYALLFAVLGPVIGAASVIDGRRLARRSARAEQARFRRGVEAAEVSIASAQRRERESLVRLALRPDDLLRSAARDPEWWRATGDDAVLVCLGLGTTASALDIDPAPAVQADLRAEQQGEVEAAYARLRSAATELDDAPALVDARLGIGIVGAAVPARALAGSIAAQLAFRLSPVDTSIRFDTNGCFGWASRLPHPRASAGPPDRIEFLVAGVGPDQPTPILCAVAPDAAGLPRECRVIIRLDASGAATLDRNPAGMPFDNLRPFFVSDSQCRALAAMATSWATSDGLVDGATTEALAFAEIPPAVAVTGRLPAAFASRAGGALTIDLVDDGPHAVIGGTTGSGKSELLISWVLALAGTCSPEEVNFLLVDFKGGSSFAAARRLPHTVGLITDLDSAAAGRALTSLRAELRYRERALADSGVRSIGELEGENRMPRLVIVVDEFAVVASEFPELQVLFADLAARGRSLGVHLILCTQRPAGVIRDSVLANCSIRISLRVNNAADSSAVIGTAAASALPPTARGRCFVSIGGSQPLAAQAALTTDGDLERVRARWSGAPHHIRRPWCDSLPAAVTAEQLVSEAREPGFAFGLSDVPEEQSQPVARYFPERDGNLAVLGGHGSGKTGMLAALQAAAAGAAPPASIERIPSDVEGAWDAVATAVIRLGEPGTMPALYLLDDIDAVVGRLPEEYQVAFIDRLARLLREGPGRGSRVVLTAARPAAGIQSLLALCDSRLLLRLPSRQEHLLAGGDGESYAAELPPGGGQWLGHRVQVMRAPPVAVSSSLRTPWPIEPSGAFALVAADARGTAERILTRLPQGSPPPTVLDIASRSPDPSRLTVAAGDAQCLLVGTPGDWQSQWSLLAAARTSGPVVFAGCTVGEFRSLTGSRVLPPPIASASGAAWMLGVDGAVTRIALPE